MINAAQLIYTNVEKEQSPQNIGGYQTLFYTREVLNEDEVELIEQRLLYYPAFDNPVKKVFFSLETGKVALAQIVALPGVDSRGRKGRYLAHALIFAENEFIKQQAEPISVLNHFRFFRTVEEALAQGAFATGHIAPVNVEVGQRPNTTAAKQWDTFGLEWLALYALKAESLAKERNALAFIGSPAEVAQALEVALLTVPSALRTQCSFDSFFYKCNFVATYFWAVGLVEKPANGRFIQIDVTGREFLENVTLSAKTAFERWTVSMLRTEHLDDIVQNKELAFSLCAWLEQKLSVLAPPESVPEDILTSVFKVNPDPLKKRVYDSLAQTLPPILVDKLLNDFNYLEASSARYAELRHGFAIEPLLELLFPALTNPNAKKPQQPIITALDKVLKQAKHRELEMLLSGWTGKVDVLRTSLNQLTEAEYRAFVTRLLRCEVLPPLSLLVPGRGSVFVNSYLENRTVPSAFIVDLVNALLNNGEAEAVTPLAPLLAGLTSRQRQTLQKKVAAYEKGVIPQAFTAALEIALKPNTGGSMLTGIKSLFGLSRKKR
ncbi:MAG: hypothetical protein DRR19_03710 [Candidatus Parabeggiatoa sp. nov. 1]|nr:MAG: hypothetical protein DRR19_03710 [Gammaproteobacteria bacterium]